MYLKRKIDEYLLEWKKNEERLPLIIKGARQVGKTESINHFAEQNYSNIVSINFVLEPKYKTILSDGYAVEDIIKNISMIDTSKDFGLLQKVSFMICLIKINMLLMIVIV